MIRIFQPGDECERAAEEGFEEGFEIEFLRQGGFEWRWLGGGDRIVDSWFRRGLVVSIDGEENRGEQENEDQAEHG